MFKLKTLGYLNPRFVRLSAISHLKKELNQYDIKYSYKEVKDLFDSLYLGTFDVEIDWMLKRCLNEIFIDNEYIDLDPVIVDPYQDMIGLLPYC